MFYLDRIKGISCDFLLALVAFSLCLQKKTKKMKTNSMTVSVFQLEIHIPVSTNY